MTGNSNQLTYTASNTNKLFSMRCVQVIAGVLGRAGEEGKLKRLAAADDGKLTFSSLLAQKLVMPGEGAESAVYPKSLKLGETIRDLEEADRPLEEIMEERKGKRELEKAQRKAKALGGPKLPPTTREDAPSNLERKGLET
jgi:hypothetical protein